MVKSLLITAIISVLSLPIWGQDVLKFGANRFAHTIGSGNTGVGINSGANLTASSPSAISNTFVGFYAGFSTNTGGYNTFIGDVSGYNNASGVANVFLGRAAGYTNNSGTDNTFVGTQAGALNTIGNSNTFVGRVAGVNNTGGNFNTFIGRNAGLVNTTGSNNVFIGFDATSVGLGAANLQNAVAIGAGAKVAISNAIILGDTTNTNIKVGIGTAAPRFPLDVKGTINIRGNGTLKFGHLSNPTYQNGLTDQVLTVDANGETVLAKVSDSTVNALSNEVNELRMYLIQLKQENEAMRKRLEQLERTRSTTISRR